MLDFAVLLVGAWLTKVLPKFFMPELYEPEDGHEAAARIEVLSG